MAIGKSGRIVIEISPDAKRRLYSQLASDGLSLKDWFSQAAESYLEMNETEQGKQKSKTKDRN